MTTEEMLEYLNTPFRFWTCPSCVQSTVNWTENIAICERCGRCSKTKEWRKGQEAIA